ncbi:MAG: GNAT family N-acetyltransferase [Beijerinckiaceae bacterium]|nr:GNAT family N-acetyltransferase [Beijerinckiaceae bacterium]
MPPGLCEIVGRIAPQNPSVALRAATADDEPFLRDLFTAIRAPEFAAAGLPEAMVAQLLGQQYRAQQAGHAAAFPQAASLVILCEGVSVGRVLLAARLTDEGWALHLVDFAVAPARQGQGLGSDLIEALARAARVTGAAALTLSVLATNTKARRLYERLGFAEAEAGVHTAMIKRL